METSLKGIFEKFTLGKPDMDGRTFSKVIKDSGLLDTKLTSTDVDLTFAKIKTSAAVRTINLA